MENKINKNTLNKNAFEQINQQKYERSTNLFQHKKPFPIIQISQ
jgi:hypothetical protein